jgi:MFS family permease
MDISVIRSSSAIQAASFTRTYLAYAVLLLFLINVVNYLDRSVLAVLMEPIRRELGFSDTRMGLLTGLSFALVYGVVGIFVASLADRYSRRVILAASIVLWSVMTALTGSAHSFWQLASARFGVGAGESSAMPTGHALLADYFSPHRRALVMGIFISGSMVGVMAGSSLAGVVAEHYGWRWAFTLAALPGLPLAWIVAKTLKEPRRGASDGPRVVQTVSLGTALRALATNPAMLLLVALFCLTGFLTSGVQAWFPTLLVRMYRLPLSTVGAYFGVAVGTGAIVGSVAGGLIASGFAARDLRWLTRVPMALSLLLWPLYALAVSGNKLSVVLGALVAVNAAASAVYGPAMAAIQYTVAPSMRATAAAFTAFAASLVGVGGAPLVIGMLSDAKRASLGEAVALQHGLFLAVSVAGAILIVVSALANRTFARTVPAHH